MKLNSQQLKSILSKMSKKATGIFDKAAKEINSMAAKKVKSASKVSSTVKKFTTAAKIATAYIDAQMADELSQKVTDLPVVGTLLQKSDVVPSWLAGKTWGQTPGLKYVVSGANYLNHMFASICGTLGIQSAQEMFENRYQAYKSGQENKSLGGTMKTINSPKFYQNLGDHAEWKMVSSYPSRIPFNYGLSRERYQDAVVTLMRNNVADATSISQRYLNMYTLMKAVRGLSGLLPYEVKDLVIANEYSIYAINEYYHLKQALRISRMSSLLDNAIPRKLLSALGWDPADFIAHSAQYRDLIIKIHTFIKENLPVVSVWPERIASIYSGMIPDDNDGNICLKYTYRLRDVTPIFKGDVTRPSSYLNSGFQQLALYPASNFYVLNVWDGSTAELLTYDEFASNFDSFRVLMNDIYNGSTKWAAILGDMRGAFGAQTVWSDSDFKSVDQDYPLLSFSDNILPLTQLKNATPIDSYNSMAIQNKDKTKYVPFAGLSHSVNLQMADGGNGNILAESANPVTYSLYTIPSNYASGTDVLTFGATPGLKPFHFQADQDGDISTWDVSTRFYQHRVTSFCADVHAHGLSESEQLECVQLMSYPINATLNIDGGGKYSTWTTWKSHDLALIHTEFIGSQNSYTAAYGSDILYANPNESISYLFNKMSAVTQGAYHPLFVCNMFDFTTVDATGASSSFMLSDINIPTYFDLTLMDLSIEYACYSMNALNLKIGNTRVNNISDALGSEKQTRDK